jgi:hypothetical protein
MRDKTKYEIEGHPGVWIINHSWVSDLGYIMVAFYNEDKGVTMNVSTRTTLEQALQLPWVHKADSDETNGPDLSIIY